MIMLIQLRKKRQVIIINGSHSSTKMSIVQNNQIILVLTVKLLL